MKIVGRPTVTPINPQKIGGATDEQVAAAVADYLAENPVESVSDEHINDLIDAKLGVIENGAY